MGVILLYMFSLGSPINAGAEYRVYQLKIGIPGVIDPLFGPRVVVSTLDQYQYTTYYPVNPNEAVEYQDSWMCYGRSDPFQALCPSPRAQRDPAGRTISPTTPYPQ